MELKYALFLAFAATFIGIRCILYWVDRMKIAPSLPFVLIGGIGLFGAALLILLFAPDSILVASTIAFIVFVIITSIGIWITGG